MHQDYGTIERKAQNFLRRHEPKPNNERCCSTCSPTLIFRFMLRTAIPILFGLASGMFIEWAEREVGLGKTNTIIELSDFSACAATLIATYTLNSLLNCCWPITPYQNNDFFQGSSSSEYTNAITIEFSGLQHDQL